MAGEIVNAYPTSILLDEYEMKSVKLLVKEVNSISGGIDELKGQILKTSTDLIDLYDTMTSSTPSSEARQNEIGTRTKKLTKAKTIYGVALPLPSELSDSQSHSWSSTEGAVSKGIGNVASSIAGAVTKRMGRVGDFINSVGSAAQGAMGHLGEVASATGARKPMIDPGYFQDYNGTEPRDFTFSWEFIPNNENESKQIKEILYHLKKYTLPTTAINGIALLSPYVFDIQIGNEYINSLINMNNVVCKSMDIKYTTKFFEDGTPKHIELSMQFAERSTVTADFY
jgi:hypothetical protein